MGSVKNVAARCMKCGHIGWFSPNEKKPDGKTGPREIRFSAWCYGHRANDFFEMIAYKPSDLWREMVTVPGGMISIKTAIGNFALCEKHGNIPVLHILNSPCRLCDSISKVEALTIKVDNLTCERSRWEVERQYVRGLLKELFQELIDGKVRLPFVLVRGLLGVYGEMGHEETSGSRR